MHTLKGGRYRSTDVDISKTVCSVRKHRQRSMYNRPSSELGKTCEEAHKCIVSHGKKQEKGVEVSV